MENIDNENNQQEDIKHEKLITVLVFSLYIAGMIMFGHYIVKSVYDTFKRKQGKNTEKTILVPKKSQIETIMYSKALSEFHESR